MTELFTSHDAAFISAVNQGFLEIFGQQELDAFTHQESQKKACDCQGRKYVTDLSQFLSEKYGREESEGLLISVGCCAYRFLKSAFDNVLGFSSLEFRLLPTRRRMEEGARHMVNNVLAPTGIQLQQHSDKKAIRWMLKDPQTCGEFPTTLIGGIFHELLTDISGGKTHPLTIGKPVNAGDHQIEIRVDSSAH
jgi:hypothetical protein